MHMIGTNLCVWLHVLIQETKHQIMIIVEPNKTAELMPELAIRWDKVDNVMEEISTDYLDTLTPEESDNHGIAKRSIEDHEIYTTHGICRRSNVIGQLVRDASQFLFPCTIEYSLICAAILYVMWKSTALDRLVNCYFCKLYSNHEKQQDNPIKINKLKMEIKKSFHFSVYIVSNLDCVNLNNTDPINLINFPGFIFQNFQKIIYEFN